MSMFINTKSLFTDEQYFVFDSTGIVIHKNLIPVEQINYMNEVIDRAVGDENPLKFPFMELDDIFFEVMCNPWIMAVCEKIIGPWFRFDHAIGIQQPGKIKTSSGNWIELGNGSGNLHGGQYTAQNSCFYASSISPNGTAWAGQLSVGICLAEQENIGGFAYIPGSHKTSFSNTGGDIHKNVMKGQYSNECIVCPKLNFGDVYIFPESSIHGMKPWTGNTRRRSLYYKYTPGYMAWRPYSEIEKYQRFATNDIRKKLLRPPYVAKFDDSTIYLGDNIWREKNQ